MSASRRPDITPPKPDLIRRPAGRFGWLPDRLLHDGWLARLGPDATAVMVLLALAADRNGCSFYGRRHMADALGLARHEVDRALARLIELRLVAHRPWHEGHLDGVWQLLPLPTCRPTPAPGAEVPPRATAESDPVAVADVVRLIVARRAAAHRADPSRSPAERPGS